MLKAAALRNRVFALIVGLAPLLATADPVDDFFARPPRVDSLDLLWTGIFRSSLVPPSPDEPVPNVRLGQGWIGPRPVRETDRIPGRIGIYFGALFTPVGAPPFRSVKYRQVVHFPQPGLRNPVGTERELKREQSFDCLINRPCFAGWRFDNPWEVVGGAWKLEVFYGETKVLEKTYVVEPESSNAPDSQKGA